MRKAVLIAAVCVVAVFSAGSAHVPLVIESIEQDNIPVVITFLNGEENKERGTIRVSFGLHNKSKKDVSAVRVRLVFFNLFNEYITTFNAVVYEDIPQGKTWGSASMMQSSIWEFPFDDPEVYIKSVFVYVSKIRMKDASIWKANNIDVAKKISDKVGYDFDASNLSEDKEDIKHLLKLLEIKAQERKDAAPKPKAPIRRTP